MKNKLLNPNILVALGFSMALVIIAVFVSSTATSNNQSNFSLGNTAIAADFQYLSQKGNSSCGGQFKESVSTMPDEARLQGSCCSPMNEHRYQEQIEGLKEFSDISEIPTNPYDIDATLAKQLLKAYDRELTAEQQAAYDFAMKNSDERGPCCCKCWRWYVYGGLGKVLIQDYGFSGAEVATIWDLSDGCGGAGDHVSEH